MSKAHVLALMIVGLGSSACKAKPQEKSPIEAASEAKATPVAAPVAATELTRGQEEIIIKDFITRFADAIDADDATRWPSVITKERAARFAQEGVINEVYAAWRQGTATVSERIRRAPFLLEKSAEKMTLHLEGVIVANDPETGYSMTVRIEDGVMYLDEN